MRIPALRIAVALTVIPLCVRSALASGLVDGVSSGNNAKIRQIYGLPRHDVQDAEAVYEEAVEQRKREYDQLGAAQSSVSGAFDDAEVGKVTVLSASDTLKSAIKAEIEVMDAVKRAEKKLVLASEDVSSAEAELRRTLTALADKRSAASAAGLAFGNKQAERDQQNYVLDVLQGLNDKYACAKLTDANIPFCDQLQEQIENAKTQAGKLDGALEPLQKAKDDADEAVKDAQVTVDKAEAGLRVSQAEFAKQVENTDLLLEGIQTAHNNHLKHLNDFVDAQMSFFAQAHQQMAELARELSGGNVGGARGMYQKDKPLFGIGNKY